MRDVCSPVNRPGGPGGKPTLLPHPPLNKIRHASVYGARADWARPDQSRPAPGDPDPFRSSISLQLDKR
jgi:hypothetical protein